MRRSITLRSVPVAVQRETAAFGGYQPDHWPPSFRAGPYGSPPSPMSLARRKPPPARRQRVCPLALHSAPRVGGRAPTTRPRKLNRASFPGWHEGTAPTTVLSPSIPSAPGSPPCFPLPRPTHIVRDNSFHVAASRARVPPLLVVRTMWRWAHQGWSAWHAHCPRPPGPQWPRQPAQAAFMPARSLRWVKTSGGGGENPASDF